MKTCPKCHRTFTWMDYGNDRVYDKKTMCPDCDHEEEEKQYQLQQENKPMVRYLATCNIKVACLIDSENEQEAKETMTRLCKKLAEEFPAIRKGWSAEVAYFGAEAAKLPGQDDIPVDQPI